MRRSLAKFSESEASNHTPSLADFTTTTPELKFSVHTGIERSLSECIATSQFDPATDIPMPTGCGRRANYTDWLGKPHEAGAFRGEVRWSDVSRPRRAQVAD